MLVPQSPEGTFVSVQDRQDPTPSVWSLQSPPHFQQVQEPFVDSSDDESLVQRVSTVPSLPGSTVWDSQTSNAIVGLTPVAAVPGPLHDSGSETERVPGIHRRTRRRLKVEFGLLSDCP